MPFPPLIFAGFIGLALICYVALDGFDLGVGLLIPFTRAKSDRALMMASIAPVWDGNETFLVLGAMIMLTGFPVATSVILPALFAPLAVMLVGLVLRGVSFEFRAYGDDRHSGAFDMAFAAGSLLTTLGQGCALGSFVQGLPVHMASDGVPAFAGGPLAWLSPFSVLVGFCLTFGYGLLGATWLIWRTDGSVQAFARAMAPVFLLAASSALLLDCIATLVVVPTALSRWWNWPGTLGLLPIPLLSVGAILFSGNAIRRGREVAPFLGALVLFASAFMGLISLLWPYAVPYSIRLDKAAARPETLAVMAGALTIFLPFVFGYLGLQYWVFRGKTRHLHAEPGSETLPLAIARTAMEGKIDDVTAEDRPRRT
jgi:cytochrome d ubiquinol oxidase subunit II